MNQKQKIVWRIEFNKKNIIRFSFFCFFGVQIIGFLIWALVYASKGVWSPTNRFLVAFPIFLLIVNFFLMRKIILKSQPKD